MEFEITDIVLAGAAILFTGTFALLFLRSEKEKVRQAEKLEQMFRNTSTLEQSNRDLMGRVSQLAEDSGKAQLAMAKTLEERLDKVTLRMGESLEKSATTTAKSIGELTTRLVVIDEAQKNMTELSGQVVGLQDILANKQARGAFGEIQLNDLVRAALPPSAYQFQATLSNGKRADCLINLPNPPGPIVVDAKFPLESYHALRNAGSEAEVAAARRGFANDIKNHIQAIADRYIVNGETAESALMFLPSEAVYAELHANFAAVVEKSYHSKVWIVSPTTLMATLNTVRAVLKDARIREQAHVIQKEVRMLMDDIGRLDKRVANLRTHFTQASKDIDEVEISSRKIAGRGERIEELELEEGAASEVEKLGPHSTRLQTGSTSSQG